MIKLWILSVRYVDYAQLKKFVFLSFAVCRNSGISTLPAPLNLQFWWAKVWILASKIMIAYVLSAALLCFLFFSVSNSDFKLLYMAHADFCNVTRNAYFSPEQLSELELMSKQKSKCFLLAHFNTRSLVKNKNLIKEFVMEIKYSPEETRYIRN